MDCAASRTSARSAPRHLPRVRQNDHMGHQGRNSSAGIGKLGGLEGGLDGASAEGETEAQLARADSEDGELALGGDRDMARSGA